MNKIITIIGNVAAGKSSAMEIVTKAAKGKAIDADDLFQTTDPFREEFLNDISRWGLANELWLTVMRTRMLREAIQKSQSNQWLVVDSGLLMSWVYTHSHYLAEKITKKEWDLYQELFCDLCGDLFATMTVIFFDYSLETLMYRLKLRGRDYELKYYTWDYLEQLQAGLMELAASLEKKGVTVVRIKESDVPDFVTDLNGAKKLSEYVKRAIGKRGHGS